MNNFGVVEIATAKTSLAPGWAYVPDTRGQPSQQAGNANNRKRARNAPAGPSIGDLTARQEVRIRKEVEVLERDGNKDNSIPVPIKPGRRAQGKTGAVRKILQSQKTFANHLDDFLAQQQAEAAAAAAAANSTRRAGGGHKHAAGADTPMTDAAADTPGTTDITAAGAGAGAAEAVLAGAYGPRPPSQPGDDDPLLVARAPELPSDQELRALLAVPPSTYLEARGSFDDDGRQPPQRVFCEVCGYWGRVRCMKCGTRVCALDCLDTHREECVTRYGL